MMDILDFTGSGQWASFSFSWTKALLYRSFYYLATQLRHAELCHMRPVMKMSLTFFTFC